MAHSSSESLSFHNDSAGVPQLQCTMPFYVLRKVYGLGVDISVFSTDWLTCFRIYPWQHGEV